jgi:5-methylcytosine-specific restriction endonuclease McrA
MDDLPELDVMSFDELDRRVQEHAAWQATLAPNDPDHDDMFAFDLKQGYIDVYWSGMEYSFELCRLDQPAKLLWFVQHIAKKGWRHTTGRRISRLIEAVAKHFGWNLYGAEAMPATVNAGPQKPKPRTTSATAERAKITPKLRYDVLYRDDFRCRACGFSVESGAHLHIDHIVAIANGGTSNIDNLQALCSVCNMGKGSR